MEKILTVVQAKYMKDYELLIHFSNGEARYFDFSPFLTKGICQKLKNMEYFKNFTIDPFSIDWNNEIGFAPEFLFENGITVNAGGVARI